MSDDTIYRQEAINVINHELRCGAVIDQCGLETAHDLIEELPSAPQQKPLKYTGESICSYCQTTNCKGCMYEPMTTEVQNG